MSYRKRIKPLRLSINTRKKFPELSDRLLRIPVVYQVSDTMSETRSSPGFMAETFQAMRNKSPKASGEEKKGNIKAIKTGTGLRNPK